VCGPCLASSSINRRILSGDYDAIFIVNVNRDGRILGAGVGVETAVVAKVVARNPAGHIGIPDFFLRDEEIRSDYALPWNRFDPADDNIGGNTSVLLVELVGSRTAAIFQSFCEIGSWP
jgi:hypothetical protein